MNWPLIITVSLAVLGLVVWLVVRNDKDRKAYEASETRQASRPEVEADEAEER